MAANNNDFLAWQQGASEAVFMLANNLGAIGNVDRQIAQDTYKDAKFGSQIQVPRPPRFVTREGPTAQTQGITEPKIVVTVQPEIGVDIEASEAQLDLFLNGQGPGTEGFKQWKERVAKPMMVALANKIDDKMYAEAGLNVYLQAGSAGVNPSTLAHILLGNTVMTELGTPKGDRVLHLSPGAHGSVMNGLSGNFVEKAINAAELDNAVDFPIAGYRKIVESQNIPTQVTGAFTNMTTAVVNGPGQSGGVLNISGMVANAILKRGDIISIAGVQSVNWQNRRATGRTATFYVTADTQASAGGLIALPIYPAIVPPIAGVPQQFQTVDSFPAAGAAVTVVSGTSGQVVQRNLAWHRQALGLVTIPMSETTAADFCYSAEFEGIRIRMWLGPDITNGRKIFRIDVLPAFPVYAPEGIAIVNGTP